MFKVDWQLPGKSACALRVLPGPVRGRQSNVISHPAEGCFAKHTAAFSPVA